MDVNWQQFKKKSWIEWHWDKWNGIKLHWIELSTYWRLVYRWFRVSFLTTFHNLKKIRSRFGRFWTLSARLLHELHHVSLTLAIMGNDAIKVRSKFDRSLSGIIERSEAVHQLPERPVVFVGRPLRCRLRQEGRFELAELLKEYSKLTKGALVTNIRRNK